jgi:hypothetical protein
MTFGVDVRFRMTGAKTRTNKTSSSQSPIFIVAFDIGTYFFLKSTWSVVNNLQQQSHQRQLSIRYRHIIRLEVNAVCSQQPTTIIPPTDNFPFDIGTYFYLKSTQSPTTYNSNPTNRQQANIIMPISRRSIPTVVFQITDKHKRKSCGQDDSSLSSTVTVDSRPFNTKQEESTTDYDAATSIRQNVSFCMSKNESFSNNVMCKEDLKELWYENSEFKYFRNFTMYAAKEITKVEARSKAPLSYERVMVHTYLSCCKATSEQSDVLTADEFESLVRWAKVATNRLGLEKWCIRSIAHDRSYRRSLMMEMVSEAQSTYQDDLVSMDDYVATSCAAISRPMRLFSRTLAQARGVAARNDLS